MADPEPALNVPPRSLRNCPRVRVEAVQQIDRKAVNEVVVVSELGDSHVEAAGA
jgi:hypothetical protein